MGCGASSSATAAAGSADEKTPQSKQATVYGDQDPEFRNLPVALSDPTAHPTSHLRLNVVFMNRTDRTKPFKLIGADHPVHHSKNFNQVYRVERKVLGSGATGDVKICTKISNNEKFALKYVNMNRLKKSEVAAFLQEVELLTALDHPNIIKLYETFQDNHKLYMIFELCPGGDLFDRVAEKGFLTEKQVVPMVRKMMSAVSYLHDRHIVHRDIKLENWIFESTDEDSEIKLIDFGLSVVYADNEKYHKVCGSVHYVAPEVLQGNYSKACDMWSMGVSVYTMLAGARPFNGRTDEEVVDQVLAGKLTFEEPVWQHISAECKTFIKGCVCTSTSARLTAKQALSHKWLQSMLSFEAPPVDAETMKSMMQYQSIGKLKKVACQAIAYHLTPAEQRKLREEFVKIDFESNGYITFDELFKALRKMDSSMTEEKIREIFEGMDIEHKGHVDYTEFLAASLQKRMFLEQESLYNAFHMLDSNDQGYISAESLHELFGDAVTSDEINSMMQETALKTPGHITFEEFKTIMTQDAHSDGDNHALTQKSLN